VQYLACTVPVPGCRHKTEHTDVQCVVSVWTADCFCIERSGDAELKASLAGRLCRNFETLRLYAWKFNALRVQEIHESFSRCIICKIHLKNKIFSMINFFNFLLNVLCTVNTQRTARQEQLLQLGYILILIIAPCLIVWCVFYVHNVLYNLDNIISRKLGFFVLPWNYQHSSA